MGNVAAEADDREGKRGIKVNLTAEEIAALDKYVPQLKKLYRSEKAGTGTVAAIIIARVVAEHPDLLKEWFGDSDLYLEPHEEFTHPSKKAARPR